MKKLFLLIFLCGCDCTDPAGNSVPCGDKAPGTVITPAASVKKPAPPPPVKPPDPPQAAVVEPDSSDGLVQISEVKGPGITIRYMLDQPGNNCWAVLFNGSQP